MHAHGKRERKKARKKEKERKRDLKLAGLFVQSGAGASTAGVPEHQAALRKESDPDLSLLSM